MEKNLLEIKNLVVQYVVDGEMMMANPGISDIYHILNHQVFDF